MSMNTQVSFQLDTGAVVRLPPSLLNNCGDGVTIQFGDGHSQATITVENPTPAKAAAFPRQRKGSRAYSRQEMSTDVSELPPVQRKRSHADTDSEDRNRSKPSVFARLATSTQPSDVLRDAPTTFAPGATEPEGFTTVRQGRRARRTRNRVLRRLQEQEAAQTAFPTENNFNPLADNTEEIAGKIDSSRLHGERPEPSARRSTVRQSSNTDKSKGKSIVRHPDSPVRYSASSSYRHHSDDVLPLRTSRREDRSDYRRRPEPQARRSPVRRSLVWRRRRPESDTRRSPVVVPRRSHVWRRRRPESDTRRSPVRAHDSSRHDAPRSPFRLPLPPPRRQWAPRTGPSEDTRVDLEESASSTVTQAPSEQTPFADPLVAKVTFAFDDSFDPDEDDQLMDEYFPYTK